MSQLIGTDIAHAANILRHGGIVAIPTETVYGLAAHALEPAAVARIFEAKGRPWFDPLIVHVSDLESARRLVVDFSPSALQLASQLWPGPLTMVLPKTSLVPDLVTAGLPAVAIRVPAHPVARELLRNTGLPLAAPSANLFGRLSPTTAAHVAEQLMDRVDYILDGGPCAVGVESTVIDLAGPKPRLLRPGGVPLEDIVAMIGPVEIARPTSDPGQKETPTAQVGPGMLPQHYAPRTKLVILAIDALLPAANRVGVLAFQNAREGNFTAQEVLSPAGDLREAAAGFFEALRRLDAASLDLIVAEAFPEAGLGLALNDRLRRAAASA